MFLGFSVASWSILSATSSIYKTRTWSTRFPRQSYLHGFKLTQCRVNQMNLFIPIINTMQVAYPIRLLHVYLYMYSRHLINDLNDNKKNLKRRGKYKGVHVCTCTYDLSHHHLARVRFVYSPFTLPYYVYIYQNIFIHFTARVLLHVSEMLVKSIISHVKWRELLTYLKISIKNVHF